MENKMLKNNGKYMQMVNNAKKQSKIFFKNLKNVGNKI